MRRPSVSLAVGSERLLKDRYYPRTYRYYQAGEVYWEDSHTLLLFSPDRYLFWRLKPSIRMNLEETPQQYGAYVIGARKAPYAFEVVTDSHGYNSPEFHCARRGSAFRIVTLGDSRTMAEGVPFDDLYARKLEALLRAPGSSTRRSRRCAPGRTAACSSILCRQAWQLRALLFGKTPARTIDHAGAGSRTARVPLDVYARNLERIADLGRRAGFRPVFLILLTSPYAYYPDLFPDQAALPAEASRALDEGRAVLPWPRFP